MSAACASCGQPSATDDSFCEICGLDLLSGELPMPPPAPAAAPPDLTAEPQPGWSALVGADHDFFQSHGADVTAGLEFPEGLQPREVTLCGPEVVVGRRNEARGYFPDIDLSSPVNDPASRVAT